MFEVLHLWWTDGRERAVEVCVVVHVHGERVRRLVVKVVSDVGITTLHGPCGHRDLPACGMTEAAPVVDPVDAPAAVQ